jgi:hypothetical protein
MYLSAEGGSIESDARSPHINQSQAWPSAGDISWFLRMKPDGNTSHLLTLNHHERKEECQKCFQ